MSIKKALYVSFLFVIVHFLSITVLTQVIIPSAANDTGLGGSNTIQGTILASTGQRLERRVVIRLQTMTVGDRTTTSDENGKFVFRGLPSGEYTILIDKEKDMQPLTQSVTVIQPRGFPPQTYNLSLRLVAKASSDAKPAVINADTAGVPKPALEIYDKAIELAKAGNSAEAITQLKAAIAAHPDFMLAYNELGVQYLRSGDLEKADEALRSALRIKSDSYTPLANRGIVLFTAKRYPEAEKVLKLALRQNEQGIVAHYFLGQTLANLGRFDEAEKSLVIALESGNPQMKEAHRLLAIIYHARGDKKRAVASLETYLKLAPDSPDRDKLQAAIKQWSSEIEPKPVSNTKPD